MNRRAWWLMALGIAALALAASATSITNGFAYDDVHLILNSPRMHTMAQWWREFARTYWPETSGGDGYRPLTILAFRLEWAARNGAPVAFHAVNIALHLLGSVAVFWLACGVLPLGAAWIAAALYAVHPVHVEAVANIVGQSELWVVLLVVLAAALYVHGRAAGPLTWKRWVAIGVLYGVACLFKEHAIVMPALLLLAEATVVADRAAVRERLSALRLPMLSLAVVALVYLWARTRVVVDVSGFQPYVVFRALNLSATDRVLTMIGASPEWVRLFLWPARLTSEYAPPYVDIAQGPALQQLPGLLLLVGILGLLVACWRRSPTTAFGIGWLVLTLLPASNFLIPAGFIIAERTLLTPSVGAMLAVGSAVPWVYERIEKWRGAQYASAAVLVLLLGLGIARSSTGNRVWHDNISLFRHQIEETPQSYRGHFMLGQQLFDNNQRIEGEMHYRHALRLFPYDALMAFGLAEQYRGAGMCEPAITMYRWMYTLEPEALRGHSGFAICLLVTLRLDEARQEALKAIRSGANVKLAREILTAANQARDSLAARRARGDTAGVLLLPRAPAH